MNLINNMLHELEKNKKEDFVSIPTISSIKPDLQPPKKLNTTARWKIVYWATVLLIAFGAIWYYHPRVIFGFSKAPKTIPTQDKIMKLAKNKIKPKTQEIKLQNIGIENKNNQTALDFTLSAPTSYYLEHASEQKLMIILNNTKIPGNLPVSLDNSFIVTLNTKQNDGNLVSILTLLPGTKIDDVQLTKESQPHLIIKFSNSQITNNIVSKAPAPLTSEEEEAKAYQEIQLLLSQDRIQSAIQNLYLFIGDYPDNLEARTTLVSLLIKDGRLEQANKVLMVGLKKHPDYPPLLKLDAHILIKQNNSRAAIELLQNHLAAVDDIEYLAMLAALYQEAGYFIPAAAIYDQLTKTEPQKMLWWLGLGLAMEGAGKINAAKVAYQRAVQTPDISPEFVTFLNNKINN